MYLLKNSWLKQINMAAAELSYEPGIDLCIHWLNPLLNKCGKPLYPDRN